VFKRYGEKVSLPDVLATVHGCWDGAAAFYVEHGAAEPGHVLVLAPEPLPEQVRGMLQALRRCHRRPQWPVRIEAAPALPLLANGKPDTAALMNLAQRTVLWRQIG
jgi:hypothetical protein